MAKRTEAGSGKANKTGAAAADSFKLKVLPSPTVAYDGGHANWSPIMDGILPVTSIDYEDYKSLVDTAINRVLYGPGRAVRRLPIFKDVCEDVNVGLVRGEECFSCLS
ncbi:hypothetical protein ACFE04_017947 [Oxalis oulophora]